MDPSLKDRESQVDDHELEGGDDPALEVAQKDGETVVTPTGMSKHELRQKKWAERVGGVVGEQTRPLQDKLEHVLRTVEGLTNSLTRMTAPAAAPAEQAKPSVDPEFMKIRRRQGEIASTMNRISAGQERMTQAQIDAMEAEYYELDQKALDLRAEKLADARLERFQRESPRQSPEVTVIQSEFADVISNQRAAAWAAAYFQQLVVESDGQLDRLAAHRKALTTAAEKFNIRRPALSPPRPHEQARFGGAPPASGAGRGTGGGYRLSKEQQELARATFDHLPPAEADRAWAESMVKRDPHFFG